MPRRQPLFLLLPAFLLRLGQQRGSPDATGEASWVGFLTQGRGGEAAGRCAEKGWWRPPAVPPPGQPCLRGTVTHRLRAREEIPSRTNPCRCSEGSKEPHLQGILRSTEPLQVLRFSLKSSRCSLEGDGDIPILQGGKLRCREVKRQTQSKNYENWNVSFGS